MTAMDGVESHRNTEENNSEIRLRKRIEFLKRYLHNGAIFR
jgi:hypothetical protein